MSIAWNGNCIVACTDENGGLRQMFVSLDGASWTRRATTKYLTNILGLPTAGVFLGLDYITGTIYPWRTPAVPAL
jgi:hypothetical protein